MDGWQGAYPAELQPTPRVPTFTGASPLAGRLLGGLWEGVSSWANQRGGGACYLGLSLSLALCRVHMYSLLATPLVEVGGAELKAAGKRDMGMTAVAAAAASVPPRLPRLG